ncbi:MAG: hypothetical protein IJJ68_03575 [Prevotella sp.]|nr:hypothetical protein [Prevotella sp.]
MKIYCLMLVGMLMGMLTACSYEEELELMDVSVRLEYPANTIDPYEGAEVEIRNAVSSVFISETNGDGVARFTVPSGIYEITSSGTHIEGNYRYIYNGVKSQVVVSPDSTNVIPLKLTVTKKRIVN